MIGRMDRACLLCDPVRAGAELFRIQVWEDDLWRLSVVRGGLGVALRDRRQGGAAVSIALTRGVTVDESPTLLTP